MSSQGNQVNLSSKVISFRMDITTIPRLPMKASEMAGSILGISLLNEMANSI